MKINLKFLFLTLLIVTLGGCTNLKDTFQMTPTYTETQKSNFKVNEKTQIFAMGSSKIGQSGEEVSKMKSRAEAESRLKKLILNESIGILNTYFTEIKNENIDISKNTIEDLANLVTSRLLKDVTETNSWKEEGADYTVLAIDKNKITDSSKSIFIIYLKDIVIDLNKAIDKISSEQIAHDNSFNTPLNETPSLEKTSSIKTIDVPTPSETSDDIPSNSTETPTEKQDESDVFLEDF